MYTIINNGHELESRIGGPDKLSSCILQGRISEGPVYVCGVNVTMAMVCVKVSLVHIIHLSGFQNAVMNKAGYKQD